MKCGTLFMTCGTTSDFRTAKCRMGGHFFKISCSVFHRRKSHTDMRNVRQINDSLSIGNSLRKKSNSLIIDLSAMKGDFLIQINTNK